VLVRGWPATLSRPSPETDVQRVLSLDPARARNRRLVELLSTSQDLRQIEGEWQRIWFTDQPSHLTPERVHGGIDWATTPQRDTQGGTAGDSIELDERKVKELREVWGRLPPRERARAAQELQRGPAFNAFGSLDARREALNRLGLNDSENEGDPRVVTRRSDGRIASRFSVPEPVAGTVMGGEIVFSPDGQSVVTAGRRFAPALLYRPSRYTADDRLYFDLLAYAPGVNTSAADIRAVLQSEARSDPRNRPGSIAGEARALIERARRPAWRTLAIPAEGLAPAYRIHFDGAGRYAWERMLPGGLHEKVVCDGKTLWHLYPELGLAARRTASRHHRLAFSQSVPLALAAADDLAHGADLVLDDERTVALVPHGAKEAKKHVRLLLLFNKDGGLAERRLVEMPAKKVMHREVYSTDGTWKVLDGNDRKVLEVKVKLEEAEAPSLKPDVKKLVVLDLPYRTPEHVRKTLDIEKKSHAELTFAQATRLLSAYMASGNAGQARDVFVNALARHDQKQIGYYVLLAAAGVNLDSDNLDVLEAHPHEPLAHYLALHSSPLLRKHASRWAASSNVWGKGILRRLGLGHALCQRWASGKSLGATVRQRRGERQRALAYVDEYKGTALAWAVLGLMQDRTAEEQDDAERKKAYQELARACARFDDSRLASLARYERARCLWRAGQADEARRLFTELYQQARKEQALLRLDSDFRDALLGAKQGWAELLRQTADELLKKKQRAAVLALARQCWQLDDQVMSRRLFSLALKDVPVKGKDGLAVHQAALDWLVQTEQRDEADRLLRKLLDDPQHAKRPELWRRAAHLAGQREQPARALQCQEKALALEYANLPELINVQQVRQDYRALLQGYAELTRALATLKLAAPAGFRDRVVAAADRWRALDREQGDACQLAAQVLRQLGERELAFDYLSTPVGLRPGEADVWLGLAGELVRWGERGLADRAFESAFQRESSNAQVLWDRAENLRRAGRLTQAQALYRRLATTEWQPRFASLKTQAQWMLDGKVGD
jgi:hypothetical protein